MRTIRQILLTEYIGAILIAVLISDAFSALITTSVAQISYYVRFRQDPYVSTHRFSTTYSLFDASVRIALYLLVAYLIARWLYPGKSSTGEHDAQAGAK